MDEQDFQSVSRHYALHFEGYASLPLKPSGQEAVSDKAGDHATGRITQLVVELELFYEYKGVLLVHGELYDVD